ncbi:MAG: exodeoxyribonuclease VII large subunit [Euryarchaeota archaeon ADurb.Bin190]|nr:MAG: exodeoxyribonuclease VII large subunit [Euryarchaeota archaeon ADurb.Bin190]
MTQIFTVSELNSRISDRLEGDLRLHDLWARGEVSNYVHHRSGHRYFTLKDREAQISCVLFRSNGGALDFEMNDGKNVLIYGDVTVYRPQGRVQLVARGIKQDEGLGFRHLQLEALKEKLAREGLFAPERKRPLPRYPQRIGIVTSPQGAALRDVLRTLGNYPARIILSPAQVQGEEAEKSIAAALLALRGRSDLIIVCRGGGSTEDLWCFNSEMVARAIFACDAPVISAVGHETDVTVADHVADARAATPTAAAKMAVPDLEEVQEALKYTKVRMMRALWAALERAEDRLGHLQHALSARRMYSLTRDCRQRLDYLSQRLEGAEAGRLKSHKSRLELLAGRLGAVGPQETLQRGYAIARSGKGLIVKATDVRPGEEIELILSQGRLLCRVLECRNDEEAML